MTRRSTGEIAHSSALGARDVTLAQLLVGAGVPILLFWGGQSYRWWRFGALSGRITDGRLLGTLGLEALLLITVFPWLLMRGWSPRATTLPPEPLDLARGLSLWIAGTFVATMIGAAVSARDPQALHAVNAAVTAGHLSIPTIAAVSLVNPVFEEFLWLGFLIPALAPRVGLRGAVAISLALRLSLHLYQGPLAFITVLPSALVLTWYYVRYRRLWAVIAAHAITDLTGLVVLAAKAHRS